MSGQCEPQQRPRPIWLVVVVGTILAMLLAGRILAVFDWNPTALLSFGEDQPELNAFVERETGYGPPVRTEEGHDGKFFFVQAMDPWISDSSLYDSYMDRPTYRSQRMLFPVIASVGGLVPARALPWTMLVVNVAAFSLGTAVSARWAQRLGGSPWWGLAFSLNLGLLAEMLVGGAGVLAACLALAGILRFDQGRLLEAAIWLAGAALAREVYILVALGLIGLLIVTKQRVPWSLPTISIGSVLLWRAYLSARLGSDSVEVREIGLPFVGLVRAFPSWIDSQLNLLAGVAVLGLSLVFILRAIRSRHALAWGIVGLAILVLFLTGVVWAQYFDITRAAAPVATAFVLLAFAGSDAPPKETEPVETPT